MASSGFYSSLAWKRLRKQALIRDGFCCKWCGTSVRGKGMSRVDHIYPVKTHPHLALVLENLRTLCPTCDNKRHAEKGGNQRTPVNAEGYPEDWQ